RLLAGASVGLALWAAAFGSAAAHAEPARATPGDGAVLAQPPPQVVIDMTQDMARQAGANDIQGLAAAGQQGAAAPAPIDNTDRRKLTVDLPANLAVGTYTVKWKTLSADDGDAADGTMTFVYDPSRAPSPGKEDFLEQAPSGGVQATAGASPAAALAST